MARPSKLDSWSASDAFRIRAWFCSIYYILLPEHDQVVAAQLERYLQHTHHPVSASRLSAWRNGTDRPSDGWIMRFRRLNSDTAAAQTWLRRDYPGGAGSYQLLLYVLDRVIDEECSVGELKDCLESITSVWLPRHRAGRSAELGHAAGGWAIEPLNEFAIDCGQVARLRVTDWLSWLPFMLGLASLLMPGHASSAYRSADIHRVDPCPELMKAWAYQVICIACLIRAIDRRSMPDIHMYDRAPEWIQAVIIEHYMLDTRSASATVRRLASMLNEVNVEDAQLVARALSLARTLVHDEMLRLGSPLSLFARSYASIRLAAV